MRRLSLQFFLSPLLLASLFFLLLQLPVWNLGISFRDEGINFYISNLLMQGKIPYRDFFLVLAPGSYYLHAVLQTVFGNYLFVSRIFYIALTILQLWLVTQIISIPKKWQYPVLFGMALIAYWPGGFADYNSEGSTMMLIALYLSHKAVQAENRWLLLFSGIASGLVFFIKQTFAIPFIPVLLVVIFLLSKKQAWKNNLLWHGVGLLLFFVLFLGFLLSEGALKIFIQTVFFFGAEVKKHQQKFLLGTVVFLPVAILCFSLFQYTTKLIKSVIVIGFASLCLLGLLFFAQSPAHLVKYINGPMYPLLVGLLILPVIPLGILLYQAFYKNPKKLSVSYGLRFIREHKLIFSMTLIYLAGYYGLAASGKSLQLPRTLAPLTFTLLISIYQFFLPKVKAIWLPVGLLVVMLLYIVATSRNPLDFHDKVYGVYDRATLTHDLNLPAGRYLKVSSQQDTDIVQVVSFITKNSSPKDTIFCFPYCAMMFPLTQRSDASYYNFFYPEFFLPENQPSAIHDLTVHPPKYIVLQRPGSIETEANFENARLAKLVSYIHQDYKTVLQDPDFVVLSPRK